MLQSFDEFWDDSAAQKVSTILDSLDGRYGGYCRYHDMLDDEEAAFFR